MDTLAILDATGATKYLNVTGAGTQLDPYVPVHNSAPLALISDKTTTLGTTYTCEAQPGSLSSAAVWQISKYQDSTGIMLWADGNANFDNIADDRATLTYS